MKTYWMETMAQTLKEGRIMTGDEKRVYYNSPMRKNSQVSAGETSITTPKRYNHGHKILLCIWWDKQNVLHCDFLKPNGTVTADVCQRQLNKLNAMQCCEKDCEKRLKWLSSELTKRPFCRMLQLLPLLQLEWKVLSRLVHSLYMARLLITAC